MVELSNGELRMSLGEVRQGEVFRTLDAGAGIGPWLLAKGNAFARPHPRRPARRIWLVPSTPAPL